MIKAVYSPEVNLSGSVVDSQWSRRARDTAATMLDHSRHRGESATKTVKFFAAHTVNCVICKNLTRIDWMLLNFTPVIQQNCHQPGRNFEKHFAQLTGWAVNLSCQIWNQPIQKRSCFWYRKLCAFSLLIWGLNVVLRYLTNSDFCVAEILYVPESSRNRPDVGNIIPITRSQPDCFTFCKTYHVIYLYWYF